MRSPQFPADLRYLCRDVLDNFSFCGCLIWTGTQTSSFATLNANRVFQGVVRSVGMFLSLVSVNSPCQCRYSDNQAPHRNRVDVLLRPPTWLTFAQSVFRGGH